MGAPRYGTDALDRPRAATRPRGGPSLRRQPLPAHGGPAPFTPVVGIDLVQISAIGQSVRSFGVRFLRRVYTSRELAYCLSDAPLAVPRLAARFAAKEAVFKVLRGHDEALPWQAVEVTRLGSGACCLVLRGTARSMARAQGVTDLALSMTHEGDYAGAVVIGCRWRARETP